MAIDNYRAARRKMALKMYHDDGLGAGIPARVRDQASARNTCPAFANNGQRSIAADVRSAVFRLIEPHHQPAAEVIFPVDADQIEERVALRLCDSGTACRSEPTRNAPFSNNLTQRFSSKICVPDLRFASSA